MDFVIFNPVPLGCTAAVGRLLRVKAAVTKSWVAVMVLLFVSRRHSSIIIIFFEVSKSGMASIKGSDGFTFSLRYVRRGIMPH